MEISSRSIADVYGWQQWPTRFARPEPRSRVLHRSMRSASTSSSSRSGSPMVSSRRRAHSRRRCRRPLPRSRGRGRSQQCRRVERSRCLLARPLDWRAPRSAQRAGQNWGLPPFLRARCANGLRAIHRLAAREHAPRRCTAHRSRDGTAASFWIPRALPQGGAYVRYDVEAMSGSLRSKACAAVVPSSARIWERYPKDSASGCTIRASSGAACCTSNLYDNPPDTVASTGTHDLPTLPAYWRDARCRRPGAPARGFSLRRHRCDRWRIDGALVAAYRYLARSASRMVLLQLDAGVGSFDQVNVPGTVDEDPNWRRKLAVPLES